MSEADDGLSLADPEKERKRQTRARDRYEKAVKAIRGYEAEIERQRDHWAKHARDTMYPGRTTRDIVIRKRDLIDIPRALVNAVGQTFPRLVSDDQQTATELMARGVELREATWDLESTQNLEGKEEMLEEYRDLAADVGEYIEGVES